MGKGVCMNSANDREPSAVDGILRWLTFGAVSVAVLAGPWFFGAWEVWWFWPFVAAICVGMLTAGLRLMLAPAVLSIVPARVWIASGSVLPFIAYAVVRASAVDVAMDAERSVLLHLTALFVAMQVVLGLSARQRGLMFWLVFANLLLLGLYGVINHLGWGSFHVMWAPRYDQYAGRATGSYFCPDHFAGAMELLLCLSIGVLADRCRGGWLKWIAAIAFMVVVAGVVMSQSRGGGLTLVVILAAAMVCGVAQWPRAVRWSLRLIGVSTGLLFLMGALHLGGDYFDRFASYDGWRVDVGHGASDAKTITQSLLRTCRGRMYGGAVRAWKTEPWLGIGPGMHQNVWPHFAPTADGNPEQGIWPTLPNYEFHSYEVHSDWLQLLEEYGVVGFFLFLVSFCTVFYILVSSVSRESRGQQLSDSGLLGRAAFSHAVGATLAAAALTFHSFGDFNLQMPATVWILAVIVAIPMGRNAEIGKAEIEQSVDCGED
jgi:O-antigen ligase